MKKGATSRFCVGGSSTGTATDGCCAGGNLLARQQGGEFTISSVATWVNY